MNSKTAELQTIQTHAATVMSLAAELEDSTTLSYEQLRFLEQSLAFVSEALQAAVEDEPKMVTYLRECNKKARETLSELRERGFDIAPNEALYEQDAAIKAVLKTQEPDERTRVELILSVGMQCGALNQLRWAARRKNNVVPLEAS